MAAQVETIDRQLKAARDQIELVEKQYTLRAETSEEMARLQRFSDAEIQYLLGDYDVASVLFYDLVANKDFQASQRYPDALFYLSDSLYQQKNYLGSRLYLRQLLAIKGAHYKEALSRYLEIAGRLNEFVGIDEYINQARAGNGAMPPELNYVYGKWLFRRPDLSLEERMSRSSTVFQQIASTNGGFQLQASYFLGVGYVNLKQWDKAIEQFRAASKLPTRDAREREVHELANLSMGRVLFEVGKYDEAIEHYQEVSRESDSFPDSLYETAWCYVRKNDLQKAKNATEVLLLVAEGSVLDPEARILQGTLQQKLTKYDEALETYNYVINQYAPVRDEIDALLTVHEDPVQYFDDLLARNEKSLDVTKLLPPVALKWASTRQEVSDAQEITSALDGSRKGLTESRQIADRILRSLDERGLESFPILQEGFTRADAVDTSASRAEEGLTRIEQQLTALLLTGAQKQQIADLRAREESLAKRIATLPTTADQVKNRKERLQAQIDALDRQAFQLSLETQSQLAQLVAVRKYADDTKSTRHNTVEDEKAFLERVQNEERGIEGVQAEIEELRSRMKAERNNADANLSGEDAIRKEYAAVLEQERAVTNTVRGQLGGDAQNILRRSDVVRTDAAALKERVQRSKGIIRDRVGVRAQKLREQVLAEQQLIADYTTQTEAVTGETRNLVGRIAFDSFKRVRQSFYDLVLKADVGVVDVAFQRKQDKTSQIQKLAQQKERELKQLDDEFKEVLKDVE